MPTYTTTTGVLVPTRNADGSCSYESEPMVEEVTRDLETGKEISRRTIPASEAK